MGFVAGTRMRLDWRLAFAIFGVVASVMLVCRRDLVTVVPLTGGAWHNDVAGARVSVGRRLALAVFDGAWWVTAVGVGRGLLTCLGSTLGSDVAGNKVTRGKVPI